MSRSMCQPTALNRQHDCGLLLPYADETEASIHTYPPGPRPRHLIAAAQAGPRGPSSWLRDP